MPERKYAIMLFGSSRFSGPHLGLREMADRCGVHADLIERFVRLGLVDPAETGPRREEWRFAAETAVRIRKIVRLRNDLGINYPGIGVVLDLLERIEELEAELR
jgi:DNA-binding transcriptional MerR regulator